MKVGTDGAVLGAWAHVEGARRVLDIGTGTGLLALMAAQRAPQAGIDAVEIDDEAAKQAGENVAASPFADRVRVHRMDVRRLKASEAYDLILCNPPFYAGEMDSPDARTGVAKHSGELAFAELIDVVDRLLAEDGRFACIVPANRERELLALAAKKELSPIRRCALHYLAKRPAKRILLELARNTEPLEEERLVVEDEPGLYTEAYRTLLKDFMLKF